jgi:heat shock transcription factor 1
MQPLGENTANTPAFLGKLWKMVNDPSTDHLICWSPSGTSFVIPNQAQFWYELLPLYYKHNNMSSFVRQLNMYGFHKLSTVENGTMDSDKDEIQFSHPFFLKDQPELLRNIKRKATTSKSSNENSNKHDELTKVLTDVKQLRGRQASVDSQLNAMKQENALLWREIAILRQKHLKQQKIVNKLIQFLVTLVQPSRMTVGVKRGYQLMLHESPNKKSKVSNSNKNHSNPEGPTIHELDSELDLTPNLYDEDIPVVSNFDL